MRGSVLAFTAAAVLLLAGCESAAQPTVVATFSGPSTTPRPLKQPTVSPAPTATAYPLAPWVKVEPSAAVDIGIPGEMYPVTDGKTIWAVGKDDKLLKVDAKTNAVDTVEAPVKLGSTMLALADDGLWATRWDLNKLYRLDPQTGVVLLEASMDKPVGIAFVGDDMWVGDESRESMFKVNRESGVVDLGTQIPGGHNAASWLGDLWLVTGVPAQMVRINPATKAVEARIDLPVETNCHIDGTFPDQAWVACWGFAPQIRERTVARIDPETNTVATAAKLPPTFGATGIAIGDHAWFAGSFSDAAGKPFAGLMRIDPVTGEIDRFFSIDGADPDAPVLAGNALWIPDQFGHRLLKVDLAQLGD